MVSIVKLLLTIHCKDTIINVHDLNFGRWILMYCFVILKSPTSTAILLTPWYQDNFPLNFCRNLWNQFLKINKTKCWMKTIILDMCLKLLKITLLHSYGKHHFRIISMKAQKLTSHVFQSRRGIKLSRPYLVISEGKIVI